jgi:K+-sensing histidine kinase KdpD
MVGVRALVKAAAVGAPLAVSNWLARRWPASFAAPARYAVAGLSVGIASLTLVVVPGAEEPEIHRLVYLVVVGVLGGLLGHGPAIFGALACGATSATLFAPEPFQLSLPHQADVVSLIVFLFIALISGELASRLRDQADTAWELARNREQLQDELVRVEVLRRTDELRRALLRAVSHDLRSPLAAIRIAAGTLRDPATELDPIARLSAAAQIEADADRLSRLVSSLLDLSRIESGAIVLDRQWYGVDELVSDTVLRTPSLSGRAVEVASPDNLPPVKLDYLLIQQALANLLDNAARYAPAGSPIRVEAHVCPPSIALMERPGHHTEVHLRVIDRGPGVPESARARVFDPFYRAGGSGKRQGESPSGAGYGLAVCAGFVQAHGGRCWVEETPGGGATFVIALPFDSGEIDAIDETLRQVPATGGVPVSP